ncbi:MAG: nucleotidyltransferase domain-containing protein [archaeon]|nr:nucleotidyltransferase domain-containing protein [archaeon]MCP8306364.1 nucleotidyltransferase domain-containing protein [archaeon]
MSKAIPTKLDKAIVDHIDRLVSKGLYVSRSEAIRDAVRELVAKRYISVSHFLRVMAEIAGEIIISNFPKVTDVILFGSVATGEADMESDIDLLVLIESKNDVEAGEMEIRIH